MRYMFLLLDIIVKYNIILLMENQITFDFEADT
jgi:hypothetical protein